MTSQQTIALFGFTIPLTYERLCFTIATIAFFITLGLSYVTSTISRDRSALIGLHAANLVVAMSFFVKASGLNGNPILTVLAVGAETNPLAHYTAAAFLFLYSWKFIFGDRRKVETSRPN